MIDLAGLLHLTRPLVFLDLESTTEEGAEPDAKEDRIVQLGVRKFYEDGKATEFTTLINPGQPIAPSATAIHGITDSMVADAPMFRDIGRVVAISMGDCDVAGYNARRYDVPLFTAECRRHGIDYDPAGVRVIDLYLLWAKVEPRNLAAWFKRMTGRELQGEHAADVDVGAAVEGLPAMLQLFPDLPRTVDELAALTARKRAPSWIDQDGRFRWRGDEPTVCFGKHDGLPMRRVPKDYWNYILRPDKDFSDDVKKLADDAKRGVYPTRRGAVELAEGADDDGQANLPGMR